MEKKFSLVAHYYQVCGCFGVDGEKYLGTVQSLSDALDLCRNNLSDYNLFSLYARVTDLYGSTVFFGCISSVDLNN